MRIISGGQTGVDRAALIAAKIVGLKTGGMMPKGFRAQDGNHPGFKELYGIEEHHSDSYKPRTLWNVQNSDATLQIAEFMNSPGELLTTKYIMKERKPFCSITIKPDEGIPKHRMDFVLEWLLEENPHVLNVAGNAESTSAGIQRVTTNFLVKLFSQLPKEDLTFLQEDLKFEV